MFFDRPLPPSAYRRGTGRLDMDFPGALAHGPEFFAEVVKHAGVSRRRILEQKRGDVISVDYPVGRRIRTSEFGECDVQIHRGGKRLVCHARWHLSRPASDGRHGESAEGTPVSVVNARQASFSLDMGSARHDTHKNALGVGANRVIAKSILT